MGCSVLNRVGPRQLFGAHPAAMGTEVNLMVGCLMPAIADRSRTANVKGLSHLVENEKSNP